MPEKQFYGTKQVEPAPIEQYIWPPGEKVVGRVQYVPVAQLTLGDVRKSHTYPKGPRQV